jgi:hypothetical protein
MPDGETGYYDRTGELRYISQGKRGWHVTVPDGGFAFRIVDGTIVPADGWGLA